MPAKVFTVSLQEPLAWKLEQLEQKTGISRSALVQKALLLLIAELNEGAFQFGQIGSTITIEALLAEYAQAEKSNPQPGA